MSHQGLTEMLINPAFAGGEWRTAKSAPATVSVNSDGVLTCSGGVGEFAFLDHYTPAVPGMRFEFDVYARKVSGDATGSGIYLEAVNDAGSGSIPNQMEPSVADWVRYTTNYSVPYIGPPVSPFVRIRLGVKSANIGNIQFHSPSIRYARAYGTPITIARGVVNLVNGTPTVNTTHASHGITSVAFNGTDTVTVTLSVALPTLNGGVLPHVLCTGTADNAVGIPVAGLVTGGAAPTFLIKWTNGATFENVSSGTWRAYFQVEL